LERRWAFRRTDELDRSAAMRLVCIGLIAAGIVGLELATPTTVP
jgi:hypothetical protein